MTAQRFWVETLGCPKNAVDSDKITASLLADGLLPADDAEHADLVVVNTCAFIDAAREESVDVMLSLGAGRKAGAKLVATGCMAERYGEELAAALPEADAVIGFARAGNIAAETGMISQPVELRRKPTGVRDLLELPRPASATPWAYLKVAEGCDRACAFCAIPSFRGAQRSRSTASILAEASALVDSGTRELVLVAQDLAWYGRDIDAPGSLAPLLRELNSLQTDGLQRIRLLYLYPSEVRDPLVATMLELETVVPYFDLSLQHASRELLARMKRWGSGDRFIELIRGIRSQRCDAVFRSSFITGFPGETEAMHDELLRFLETAQLDWAGFFAYSQEPGTAAATLDGVIDRAIVRERLDELAAVQEPITNAARRSLIGQRVELLVDGVEDGEVVGRTFREAPEIDGVVRIRSDETPQIGALIEATITDAEGPDLFATSVHTGVAS